MMPEQAGRYRGEVLETGVARTGQNSLLTVTLRFMLTDFLEAGTWVPIEERGLEITSYNYLEKKDGSLNERTIRTLQEVFGWPGADPFWFEDTSDLLRAQLTLEYEEWQGQEKLKVRWLNPWDSEGPGGLAKADPDERRAIMAQIGSKLRAFAGGGPSPAPRPSAAPPPPRASAAPDALTEEVVWARWCSECVTHGIADKDRDDHYNAAIRSVERGEVGKNLSSAEWGQVEVALGETLERLETEDAEALDAERAALNGEPVGEVG